MAYSERASQVDAVSGAGTRSGGATVVRIAGREIGNGELTIFAGPCAVETREQIMATAQVVAHHGAHVLRGGAFKPRSSPHSFQGLAQEGLELLAEARGRFGLPVVTEVMSARDVELISRYADVLQVGARNMQNFDLLREVGRGGKPVILKRGMAATIEEWLLAAEYIIVEGNHQVILCERGIRTFESATRNTLDLSAIPVVKQLSSLPVIVDPSHGTGRADLILPMALAAAAAGADGLMIEVHIHPEEAWCDGQQSLGPGAFRELMDELVPYVELRRERKALDRNGVREEAPRGDRSLEIYPDRREFGRLAASANIIPVYCELTADMETPVSLFQKVAAGPSPSFMLESVEGGQRPGRYSFIGSRPFMILESRGEVLERFERTPAGEELREVITGIDPLAEVQRQLDRFRQADIPDLPPFTGGAVGYIGYEAVKFCEPILKLSENRVSAETEGLPDIFLMFTEYLLAFDHVRHTVRIIVNARTQDQAPDQAYDQATAMLEGLAARVYGPGDLNHPAPEQSIPGRSFDDRLDFVSNMTPEAFEESVGRAKEHIRAGDIFQVVLSQRLTRELRCHPFELYRAMRTVNPSPYLFYLDCGGFQLVGSSPESHVRADGGRVRLNPIAGTRRRGKDAREDAELETELLADEKERSEHVMLVDLARNDLGRACEYGSVQVTEFMGIERYSHVMHIVSRVEGILAGNMKPLDVLRATFPAGTVTGAPKVRAMQIISDLEPDRRGPYSGVVGYFDFSGNLDVCITIRTVSVKNGRASVQAGAGIVADSDPRREYEETLSKARGMLAACERAEGRRRR